MNTNEITLLMQKTAEDAVSIAKNDFAQDLDFSAQSVSKIEVIMLTYAVSHEETPLTKEQLFTIANVFGAYIGECYKRVVGGEWFYDESDTEAPYATINYASKSFPFPSICYQKLVNDKTINIAKYFDLALSGTSQ